MDMGGSLRTLNSRVRGSNTIACSIYSFDGVFPDLGLLHSGCDLSNNLLHLNLRHSRFTAHIRSVNRMVIRDEIHVLYVIGWCAVVRRWVRNTLHSPIIFVKKVCNISLVYCWQLYSERYIV